MNAKRHDCRPLSALPEGVAVTDLIPLGELPDHLPRRAGRKRHKSAAYRWVDAGLPFALVNGSRHTCLPWVDEWERRKADAPAVPHGRLAVQRDRDTAEADDELAAAGWA